MGSPGVLGPKTEDRPSLRAEAFFRRARHDRVCRRRPVAADVLEEIMRAVWLRSFGGPEALVAEETPEPSPGPGQVLVDVVYANITFVETQVRAGRAPFPVSLPMVPGNGGGGVVRTVGGDGDP